MRIARRRAKQLPADANTADRSNVNRADPWGSKSSKPTPATALSQRSCGPIESYGNGSLLCNALEPALTGELRFRIPRRRPSSGGPPYLKIRFRSTDFQGTSENVADPRTRRLNRASQVVGRAAEA